MIDMTDLLESIYGDADAVKQIFKQREEDIPKFKNLVEANFKNYKDADIRLLAHDLARVYLISFTDYDVAFTHSSTNHNWEQFLENEWQEVTQKIKQFLIEQKNENHTT